MRPPLRSSGPRPHGNSIRPPFKPAGHRPHGPSMNPRRPTMNAARSYKTFFQTPSFETRPFFKSSAVKNSYRAPWVPTVNSPIVRKRKGNEVMVESDTLKKKKLHEQIDAQVARELEEQQEREDMKMNEQIARHAEVARIHAEEEIHGMFDSLDKANEIVAKYLQEYQQFASDLSLEKKIELI
nr:hypothetical protein [Tanacetum cinerariifolium]